MMNTVGKKEGQGCQDDSFQADQARQNLENLGERRPSRSAKFRKTDSHARTPRSGYFPNKLIAHFYPYMTCVMDPSQQIDTEHISFSPKGDCPKNMKTRLHTASSQTFQQFLLQKGVLDPLVLSKQI